MFNTIKRMRFIAVSVAVLMLIGVLPFQAEANDPTTTPNAVRTGIAAAVGYGSGLFNPFPYIFYQGFDGNLWSTYKSGSSWLPVTNYGQPSSTVGIASAIATIWGLNGWAVWVTGTDGNLWLAYQSGSSYVWSNYGQPSSTVGIANTIGAYPISGSSGSSYGWEVWVTGTDGNLWLASQSPGSSSHAWANYGQPSSTVGIASTIGTYYVSSYSSGWRVWVTGTDGNLWLAYQSISWCGPWRYCTSYGWANYGKPSSTVGIASTIGTYNLNNSSTGVTYYWVWVTGTDGNLWNLLLTQSGTGSFSYAWANYGQPSSTVGIASTIGAKYVYDSISGYGWQIWVTGTDGNLWLASQFGSSHAWTNYGTPGSTVGIASTIGAYNYYGVGWGVWVTGTDGNLWLASQSGSSYAWANYGQPSSTVGIASTIGAYYVGAGLSLGWKVFIIGSDSNLWCAEQNGSSWTWTQLTNANVAHSYLNPKYKILSIDYAPPGNKSNETYISGTVRGASTTQSGTFMNSISVTASLNFLVTGLSTTETWTQQYDSSSSDSFTLTTSKGEVIPGPLYAYLGVDHDLDRIKLWLNPANVMTVTGPSSARWDGWATNGDDTPVGTDIYGIPNMDIVSLSVSQLKNPSTIDPGTALLLARTWDTSGVGGLTSDDFAAILAADPFTNASCNPNDIDANGSRRFDPLGVTINYQPAPPNGQPITQTYSVLNQSTSQVGKGATYSYQVKVEVKGGFMGNGGSVSDTFGWTDKRSSTDTIGSSNTASFSITGPAYTDNYTGPVEFQVWRDNIYGTYMFYPVQ